MLTKAEIEANRDCVLELIEAYHSRVGGGSLFEDISRNALGVLFEAALQSTERGLNPANPDWEAEMRVLKPGWTSYGDIADHLQLPDGTEEWPLPLTVAYSRGENGVVIAHWLEHDIVCGGYTVGAAGLKLAMAIRVQLGKAGNYRKPAPPEFWPVPPAPDGGQEG